jgi:tetratricopeptide (TPR) repeat protein
MAVAAVSSTRAGAQDASTQALLADANAAYRRGDHNTAASYFDYAISAEPRGVDAASFAKRASIFLRAKAYAAGLAWIRNVAARHHPGAPLIREQEALILAQLNRIEEAVQIAEAVVLDRPQAYTLQLMIGTHYFGSDHRKSISAYLGFLATRPGSASAQDKVVHIKLGASYLASRDHEGALVAFGKALRAKGQKSLDHVARLGMCATFSGMADWERTTETCAQVATALPRSARAVFHLARAHLHKGAYPKALVYAERYCQLSGNDASCHLLRGDLLLAQHSNDGAEREYVQAEALEPQSAKVLHRLGKLFLERANPRPQQAVAKLEEAHARVPGDVEIMADLCVAYMAAGHTRRASVLASQASALVEPGSRSQARLLVLSGDASLGDDEGAQAAYHAYRGALSIDGKDATAKAGLVTALNVLAARDFADGAIPEAIVRLEEAHGLDPSSRMSRVNLGVARLRARAFSEAIAILAPLTEALEKDALAHRLLARAYAGAHDAEKSARQYELAAAAAVGPLQRSLLAEIQAEWGVVALERGELEKAVVLLDRAAGAGQDAAFASLAKRYLGDAYCRRGYAHLLEGRYARAVDDLIRATEEQTVVGNAAPCAFALAMGYLGMGKAARAREITSELEAGEKRRERGTSGGIVSWLEPTLGGAVLAYVRAFAAYADKNASAESLERVVEELKTLEKGAEGPLKKNVRGLLRSVLERVAERQMMDGKRQAARATLERAMEYADKSEAQVLVHNLVALGMPGNAVEAKAQFEELSSTLPEALVNLGIVFDLSGESRKAYDVWVAAKQNGVRARWLEQWIESKQRVFGY